jgi:hypothetical protein
MRGEERERARREEDLKVVVVSQSSDIHEQMGRISHYFLSSILNSPAKMQNRDTVPRRLLAAIYRYFRCYGTRDSRINSLF